MSSSSLWLVVTPPRRRAGLVPHLLPDCLELVTRHSRRVLCPMCWAVREHRGPPPPLSSAVDAGEVVHAQPQHGIGEQRVPARDERDGPVGHAAPTPRPRHLVQLDHLTRQPAKYAPPQGLQYCRSDDVSSSVELDPFGLSTSSPRRPLRFASQSVAVKS